MEWLYKQSTGELFLRGSPVTTPFALCYSGIGTGKNNPDLQCAKDIGPIPRGSYTFDGITDTPAKFTIKLKPHPDNEMCGRSGFLIHADSISAPGWASQGCIVLKDLSIRERVATSGVTTLIVIS